MEIILEFIGESRKRRKEKIIITYIMIVVKYNLTHAKIHENKGYF